LKRLKEYLEVHLDQVRVSNPGFHGVAGIHIKLFVRQDPTAGSRIGSGKRIILMES